MQEPISIRILEKDSNRRGDLFGRLMADLFVALGYEQPRLNIHKSGRELDLSADHRLEPRRAIGECKATVETTGGDELNKFVGALDAEHADDRPVTGYFISLAGFKETAIEQERQRRTKIVTLDGTQVVGELIKGRILIAKDRATELSGRCCVASPDCALDPEADLLAHERGWIWAIYYGHGKVRTHFALIHSDGTPLARALAEEVTVADRECGGALYKLTCLNPEPPLGSDTDPRVTAALAAYSQYLANECGYIQLDGLPADSDIGSRRLRLESLFVPLHLDVRIRTSGKEKITTERQSVGAVLAEHPRLALLAAPGGGKSTLVKRLAIAYADPARREEIADTLPSRNWLPLFFRCRELRDLARGSFAELLQALSQREPVRQYAAVFRAFLDRALFAGRILLLVDGLDEISDPGDRSAFVCTVRSALQAYPGTAIVVTSREAGFRHVAAHLASICTHATVSAFVPDDIRRLSVAWHREVVGDTEKVRVDAVQLAAAILRSDRIQRLATNPLLLTTLLLVKRWVGSLPTRRVILYGKAVELLLMTWNVEGHDPIPEEEAMPQLCYIASGMMLAGLQKISRPRLASLLQDAREALPTELGYVKGTVDEFIHRVEDRSSLLMMTGHDVENGRLVEFFEFRHLTFQEFLTARAVVEGWHPGRNDHDTLVSVLEPHFAHEEWREVIPLAAVLGGKATDELIQRLTQLVIGIDRGKPLGGLEPAAWIDLLGHSLADEAAARPDTIRAAIRTLVTSGVAYPQQTFFSMLVLGKYGAVLRNVAQQAFLAEESQVAQIANTLKEVVWWQAAEGDTRLALSLDANPFLGMLSHNDALTRCEGVLGCVAILQEMREPTAIEFDTAAIVCISDALVSFLFSKKPAEQYVAGWGLYELGRHRLWTPPPAPDVLGRMFELWRHSPVGDVRAGLSGTIAMQPLAPRDDGGRCISIKRNEVEALFKQFEKLDDHSEKIAALVVAWYVRALNDEQLAEHVWTLLKLTGERRPYLGRTLEDLAVHLGEWREKSNK